MVDSSLALTLLVGAVGVALLFESSRRAIENAIKLARIFRVSETAIGFLLVAAATSMPEFFIGIISALQGKSDISVGNVFGANVANAMLVVGAAALIRGVAIEKKTVNEHVLLMAAAIGISVFLTLFNPSRFTGILLLLLYALFVKRVLEGSKYKVEEDVKTRRESPLMPLAYFAFSMVLVILSSKLVVDSAISLTSSLGLAATVVGATIVSIGTTLPELSVTIAAARRGAVRLAIGNAIGSIMTNLLLIFGTTLLINPAITFNAADKVVQLSILAYVGLIHIKVLKTRLVKTDGLVMLAAYVAFLGLVVFS